jgi:hypothetical protein
MPNQPEEEDRVTDYLKMVLEGLVKTPGVSVRRIKNPVSKRVIYKFYLTDPNDSLFNDDIVFNGLVKMTRRTATKFYPEYAQGWTIDLTKADKPLGIV